MSNIYFLIKGKCGFVLPKYKNTTYIEISIGDHFGVIDIVGSILKTSFELETWFAHKDVISRQFTVMSLKESEALLLSISDLFRMKQEFLEAYEKMFNDAYIRLRRALTLKLKAMKICQDKEDDLVSQRSGSQRSEEEYSGMADPQNLTRRLSLSVTENA